MQRWEKDCAQDTGRHIGSSRATFVPEGPQGKRATSQTKQDRPHLELKRISWHIRSRPETRAQFTRVAARYIFQMRVCIWPRTYAPEILCIYTCLRTYISTLQLLTSESSSASNRSATEIISRKGRRFRLSLENLCEPDHPKTITLKKKQKQKRGAGGQKARFFRANLSNCFVSATQSQGYASVPCCHVSK